MSNLSRLIRRSALRDPLAPAIVHAGEAISYEALRRRIAMVAALLVSRGIAPGNRVALLMKNSPAFIEIALAVSHAGAVLVPINYRLAADEIAFILADAGARLLFVDAELANPLFTCPTIIVDAAALADASRLCAGGALDDPVPRGADDLFRIMYTSGTTDRPKGVLHSYRNFQAKSADQIVELGLSRATRLLVCGPLYHVGAFDLPGVAVLWTGGMLCIQREFDAAGALALIADHALTGAWLAPVMAGALIAEQAGAPRDTRSLVWAIGGGERTPEARIRAFAAAFPSARYIDAYGLTETCGGDTLMEAGREIDKIGSVGRPLAGIDVTIRDDAGAPLPAGTEGEVCLRGEKVTAGYWNAPEKTTASFHGAWLRTGDVGYLDADGFLFLTDRKKDLIISGGENIASSEIERVLHAHGDVRDAAVIGAPDARWGERPVAFVVLREGAVAGDAAATGDALRAHCRAHLAGFRVPDRVIVIADLPRSASGKVLKRELRRLLAQSAA